VPYSTEDARQQLLESVAAAAEALAAALAALTEAYEQLDEATGDRVEEQLFRPVQRAYGRARSAYTGFATRHSMATRELEQQAGRAAPSHGVKGLIEDAVSDVQRAEYTLVTLQDSLLPVEMGDAQLRADLEQVRELISGLSGRAREVLRTFGR
jgi:hypothetical protein